MSGYGDDAGLDAWLASYGYALPSGAPSNAILRQRASDYLDGLYSDVGAQDNAYSWTGYVADPVNQERQWPRISATAGSVVIASDAIPTAVINASYYAAYIEANKPGSLSVTGSASARAVRKKVNGIEIQYSDPGAAGDIGMDMAPVNTVIFGMVKPFLTNRSSSPMALLSIGGGCG